MTELELKIANLELAIKEYQRLKKLSEETVDVSLVDLEVLGGGLKLPVRSGMSQPVKANALVDLD